METRRFNLALPPSSHGPEVASLRFEADASLIVPAQLHRRGLAQYEPETVATFLAALDFLRPDLVLDIGANVGIFALLAGVASEAQVIGFEPEPHLAETAGRIARANHLANVKFHEIALSDRNGTATFYLSSTSDSSHSIVEGFRNPKGKIEVATQTLDGFMGHRSAKLIKLDVEMAEPLVLVGGKETIRRDRPWLIIEVLGRRTEQEIEAFFADLGYVPYQITKENPLIPRKEVFGDRAGVFRNWLFAPIDPPSLFWQTRKAYQRDLRKCIPIQDASMRTRLRLPGPVINTRQGAAWAPTWNSVPREGPRAAAPKENGAFEIRVAEDAQTRWYLSHGQTPFDSPPADAELWKLDPNRDYELSWSEVVEAGGLEIAVAVIQYSATSRLRTSWAPQEGDRRIAFKTDSDTSAMRLAVRIKGAGRAVLGPFVLDRLD